MTTDLQMFQVNDIDCMGYTHTYISSEGVEVGAVILIDELVINFLFIDQRLRLSRNRTK